LVEQRIEKVEFRANFQHFWRLQHGCKKVRRTLFGSAANPSLKYIFKWFQTTPVAFAWLFNGSALQLAQPSAFSAALERIYKPYSTLLAQRVDAECWAR
jgi:hypothetical protein